MSGDLLTWVREHFETFEEKGAETAVRCPFHEDKNPSAGVNVEKTTFHCFTCGDAAPGKLSDVASRMGWDAPPLSGNGHSASPEAEYAYRDAAGRVVAIKKRLPPKEPGKKNMLWCDAQGAPGLKGKGVVVPLYRLPELTAALERGEVVAICEGEKDAERVTAAEICATTCPGGAGQWRDIDTACFPAGAQVLVFWDADLPGAKHRDMVGQALAKQGCVVKVVDLGFEVVAAHGRDISDWMSDPQRGEEDFLDLVRRARPWGEKTNPYRLSTIADISAYPEPAYLIQDFLIKGAVHVLGSRPGDGKSLVCLEAAKSLVDGFPFLGRLAVCVRGPVLYVDEENPGPLLARRLRMMGMMNPADHQVYFLHFQGVRIDTDEGMGFLLDHVQKIKPVLLVLDSLVRLHRADENVSGEMAMVMGNIRRITNEGNTTTLVQHHHVKGDVGAKSRLRGSGDIQAACDVEYQITEERGGLVMSVAKTRVAPIEPLSIKIVEEGDTLHVLATDAAPTDAQAVRAVILDILGAGEATAADVHEAAKSRGTPGTLRDIRDTLSALEAKGKVGHRVGAHRAYHYRLREAE